MSDAYYRSQRACWAPGQPISQLMATALANPDLISLAAGFVDQQTLPVEPVRQATAELLSDPDAAQAALQYGTTPGHALLRDLILQRAQQADGLLGAADQPSIEQVVLTAGSNQLLHLVAESLVDPGDIMLCAAPTYLVFLGTLGNLGARSYGVATDHEGMIPEALDEAFRRIKAGGELPRVKGVYLVPYYDNPCGITMPPKRREQIVELVEKWSGPHKIPIISDEAYRDLRYGGDDQPSLRALDPQGDTVIATGTFSKSFSPGIRVGWGILPPHLVEPVCNQKGNIDFGSPNFNQHLMAQVLQQGLLDPHLESIRASYRVKLQAMLDAADQYLDPLDGVHWHPASGGLYVWVHLPKQLDAGPDGRLFNTAIQQGMLYVPGQYCYPRHGEPVHNNTLRLSFGVQTPEKIRQGVAALARAIEVTGDR